MAKTCLNCGVTHMKPEKYFGVDKKRKDGLNIYCKECNREFYKFYSERFKKPKEERKCRYSKCNIVFSTSKLNKEYCCPTHRKYASMERVGLEKTKEHSNFMRRFRRKKEKAENSRKHWTFEDIEILMDSKKEGISYKEIALRLNRKVEAVQNKFYSILKQRGLKSDLKKISE